MNQYFRATIKIAYEANNGRERFRKENYIVYAINPTDVEEKLGKHLGMTDYELVGVNLISIVDIVK